VTEGEREAMMGCQGCALRLVEVHMTMASKGLMVYCSCTLSIYMVDV
jgi:hypothetical protein